MTKKITTLNTLAASVAIGLISTYGPTVSAGETEWSGFIENATYHRETRGISKSRNTAQLEFSRYFDSSNSGWNSVSLHGALRGTYDAVYDLNDNEFGSGAGAGAGQDIFLETTLNGASIPVAHGSGLNAATVDGAYALLNANPAGIPGLPTFPAASAFVDSYPNNPSEGMRVLGEDLHQIAGGVAFGVPVRPCDEDNRGCIKDYMDADEKDLKHPEFNDRMDFLREFYIDATRTLDNGDELNVRLGRQQVVWGRTDLFRVLDVLNPVDYSRHSIYDELEDTRIPMWMLQMERRMGPTGGFDDLNASVVWNFDKFRPHNLGSCSGAYNPLDAACFFRGMKNLWDNGGTVANFAPINAAGLPAGLAPILGPNVAAANGIVDPATIAALSDPTIAGMAATNFGPNQIGIRDIHLPGWSLDNTQLGAKLEGVYGDLNFSVNALTYRSQFPSLRGGTKVDNSENPFVKGDIGPTPSLIAFDIYFPRVNLIGGSLDYYSESLDTVFRFEGAYSQGEEFADSMSEDLYSDSDVFRYVVGIDKTIMIPALNKSRGFLFSGQLFGEHLLDHRSEQATYGERGFASWKSNNIATLLIKGWWMNDRLSPQIIMAHDFRAQSSVAAPMVEWLVNDNWKLMASANIKFGDGAKAADDCRSCNPYGPFTAYPAAEHGAGLTNGSAGLSSFEPTGRFRSGILGMANEEDEYQLTVQYRF